MSVSLGTQAALLIRLDARLGEWVAVDVLAGYHHLSHGAVRAALQQLWDAGYVRCSLDADGLIAAAQATALGG